MSNPILNGGGKGPLIAIIAGAVGWSLLTEEIKAATATMATGEVLLLAAGLTAFAYFVYTGSQGDE